MSQRSLCGASLIALMVLFFLMSACASGRGFSSDESRRARAAEHLKAGRWSAAFDNLSIDLARPSEAYRGKALRIIKPYPGFGPGMIDQITKDIAAVTTTSDAVSTRRRIEHLREAQIVSNLDIAQLHAELAQAVAAGSASGRLPFMFSDPVEEFPILATDDAAAIIFTRSLLRAVEEKPPGDRLLEGVMAYVAGRGQGSPAHTLVQRALPSIEFSLSQLQGIVRRVYPAFAESTLAALSVSVYLATEPSRRLLEEDLGGILQRRSPLLRVTRQRELGSIAVVLRELQYEERQSQERTRTVTVGYGEHDIAVAVLLLPRNASTLFEVTEGGAEVTWAFEVIGRRGGVIIHEQLVRDRIGEAYHFCSNFRVVNVFGGVLRASTFPNGQTRSYCESGRQPISASSLRSRVLDRLADAIAQIPPVADAVRRAN